MVARWKRLRSHLWFIHRYGFLAYVRYEAERRERERATGEKFDPLKHGERLLRAIGASDEQIADARVRGLA